MSASGGRTEHQLHVTALRFFFTVTLDRADIIKHLTFVPEPRKIPIVLSPEEVVRLLEAAPGVKYEVAFSVANGAGLTAILRARIVHKLQQLGRRHWK
jgi:hypothetical protein